MAACGRCHTCGTDLRIVLDGEEWCGTCERYERYYSHGWTRSRFNDDSLCPPAAGPPPKSLDQPGTRGGTP